MASSSSLFLLFLLSFLHSSSSVTFTIVNLCNYTVWPGLLSGSGIPQLSTTGFTLPPLRSAVVPVPLSWSGRIWGRTLCAPDSSSGRLSCLTGDCGSGGVECAGAGAAPPATLAEFTLNGASGLDFYDVSLVDGYNLPMWVAPLPHGGGTCAPTGCAADLNPGCPRELRMARGGNSSAMVVACRSACEAFGTSQYCCSGDHATPATCSPTTYSRYFKRDCPLAYSYAYDDGTSTFTCNSADYIITFCPLSSAPSQPPALPPQGDEDSRRWRGGGGGEEMLPFTSAGSSSGRVQTAIWVIVIVGAAAVKAGVI